MRSLSVFLNKLFLVGFSIFISTSVFAESINLFTLYRTNYYPEKTYSYNLEYDKKNCRITSSNPISVYFISTSNGAAISGFSGKNKEYFSAKNINSPNAQNLTFSFKAINELESIMRKKLDLSVQLVQMGNSCSVKTNFLSGNSVAITDLKRINVEFNLKDMPPFGMQPSSINWLKLIGRNRQSCLIGNCK
jgi:hypothetical protein